MHAFYLVSANLDWGGRGFSYALENAHLPGILVCVILLALSIISWSIMFTKFSVVSKASRQNLKFFHIFRKSPSALGPHEANEPIPFSPLYAVYRSGCRELVHHLLGTAEPQGSLSAHLQNASYITPHQLEAVRSEMNRATGEMVLHLERKMNLLATVVSGAPFLGLLGTVWGVMETFGAAASTSGTMSLQTMAPGVSAALVTTVFALLVAIPAMFGYNFLISRIRELILEMNNFTSELCTVFERQYVDYSGMSAPAVAANYDYAQADVYGSAYPDQQTAPISPLPDQQSYTTAENHQDYSQGGYSQADYDQSSYQSSSDTYTPLRPRIGRESSGSGGPPINPIAEQTRRRRTGS